MKKDSQPPPIPLGARKPRRPITDTSQPPPSATTEKITTDQIVWISDANSEESGEQIILPPPLPAHDKPNGG